VATPFGLMRFPGLNKVLRGSFTYSNHGITPSRALIDIVPQQGIPPLQNTLTVTFDRTAIPFYGCIIDSASMRRNAGGFIVGCHILDRRWKWATGEISGKYNIRNEDGVLETANRKTPRELATLCLRAMNESGFSVNELPNGTNLRPFIHWIFANPAQALDELCNRYGCAVSLELDGKVRIRKVGVGVPLPNLSTLRSVSYSFNPGNFPDSIKVVGGKILYEVRWKLQAVGMDTDKQIKPIDDLSYKPDGGWEKESPTHMTNTLKEFGEEARALALKSVFKWYQVKWTVDYYNNLDFTRKQCLPILQQLIDQGIDFESNKTTPLPPVVYGVYWAGLNKADEVNNTAAGKVVDTKFNFMPNEGIIDFGGCMFQIAGTLAGGDVTIAQADLWLETSCYAKGTYRDRNEQLWNRYYYEKKLRSNPIGTGPLIVRDESIVLTIQADSYDINSSSTPPTHRVYTRTDNLLEVERQAKAIAEAKANEFQTLRSLSAEYAGIEKIALDGARNQISWNVGPQGATTKIGFNNEFDSIEPNAVQRRVGKQLQTIVNAPKTAGPTRSENLPGE